jgi:uncharacterized protein YndB with AHSA1/START domain
MQKEIKHSWHFNQSPQEVWEYLTKPELLEQWLMKSDFKPVLGHKFRLEIKPFTTLTYSWRKKSDKDGKPFDSKVVWTLTPKDNGTELQIVHNGFTAIEDVIAHEKGWAFLGNQFVELLNSIKK